MFIFYLDAKINGFVFLNLNESMLRLFGVSFGFQFILMNIIGHLVGSLAITNITDFSSYNPGVYFYRIVNLQQLVLIPPWYSSSQALMLLCNKIKQDLVG